MNEFIQFVKSFILILINTNNFENKLISHTFQSLSFLSIRILQKNISRTQLLIETPLKS